MNQTHWPLLAFTLIVLAAMLIPVLRTRAGPVGKTPGDPIHRPDMANTAADEWMSHGDTEAIALREAEEKRWIAERDAANAEWRARWPNHCQACRGWGGAVHHESHGFRHGTAEQIFDLCDAIPETQCHRCGEHGLTDEGEGLAPGADGTSTTVSKPSQTAHPGEEHAAQTSTDVARHSQVEDGPEITVRQGHHRKCQSDGDGHQSRSQAGRAVDWRAD